MKKKVLMFIMPLLAFLIGPNLVSATSLRVSVSCSDVTVGSTTRCTVTGTTDGQISSMHGEYSINGGASFNSFSVGSGWLGEEIMDRLISIQIQTKQIPLLLEHLR